MLKDEFQYYLDNQAQLVEQYNNKFIVIKDKTVIGSYDKEDVALSESLKLHQIGTFIIQKCTPGSTGHTQTYHSRVAFA